VLIVDTSCLIAAADISDPRHDECATLLGATGPPAVVPILTIAETSYLIASRLGARAETLFVRALAAGHLAVEPVEPEDWTRISDLVSQYADLSLGVVDASIVAAAERLGSVTIATLDYRHFSVVRPRHAAAFSLVP
jgi:predicted nucleic acid-binding protein